MAIVRKNNYKRKKEKEVETIDMALDVMALNILCSFVISENQTIQRNHLINLKKFIDALNKEQFVGDPDKMSRLSFIERGLYAKVVENINNPAMVITYINGGLLDDSIIDVNNFREVTNDEVRWINQMVTESLDYAFINNDIFALMDVCTRFKSGEFGRKAEIVTEMKEIVNNMQTKFRRNEIESITETTFTLKDGIFEEVVREFHKQLSSPSHKLYCGMQGMNQMIGGFESGRIYLFFGLQGEGKSLLLLNLAYQIKKWNKNYKPKDPTKTPCVVLLLMENVVRETCNRLFKIACDEGDLINFSADEAIEIMRSKGELYLSNVSPIDIIIKFVPDNSVDTNYLYTLADNLEDEGYEVICVLQDYIKRIRAANYTGDPRLDYGSIVNEFKTFAMHKDIPVISASQLNRDATRHIDDGRKTNKPDLLRLLGRSNIGESMLMLDNTDWAGMLVPEYDSEGNKWFGIQSVKDRTGQDSVRNHFYQPFSPGNGLKLIEDFDSSIPVFRESMMEGAEEFINRNKKSSYQTNSIREIDNGIKIRENDNEINFFTSARFQSPVRCKAVSVFVDIDTAV